MSSIIRARSGDMVVSFRWWADGRLQPADQKGYIQLTVDFATPTLGAAVPSNNRIWYITGFLNTPD
jgi:hypothetical protein